MLFGKSSAARTKRVKEPETGLTKEKIIHAALELIDRDGIEEFSMRSVAKALNVFPTAIYWHVPGRNSLLAEVVSLVLRDLAPEMAAGRWQDRLRALFIRYRQIIRKHPNVAPLVGVQLVSNASIDFELVERVLATLSEAGFSGRRLVAAYNVVIGGMVGFTTQEFALVPSDGTNEWQDSIKQSIATIDRDRFPTVARNIRGLTNRAFIMRWENGASAPLNDGFTMFVDALIVGLETMATQSQPHVARPARRPRS